MSQIPSRRTSFRRPAARRLALLALAVGLLGGCGGRISDPYFVTVPQQTLDPVTALPLFSVCYNATLHSASSVRSLVAQHCANPNPISNGSDLQRCSLSAPVRVTYTCTALSRTAAEAKPNLSTDTILGSSIAF